LFSRFITPSVEVINGTRDANQCVSVIEFINQLRMDTDFINNIEIDSSKKLFKKVEKKCKKND